jgi:hypothetical protein
MTYMFNGGLYHDACIIENCWLLVSLLPAAGTWRPAKRWWAREANAIDEDHGSDEWPVSLAPQEEAEHEDASCDR